MTKIRRLLWQSVFTEELSLSVLAVSEHVRDALTGCGAPGVSVAVLHGKVREGQVLRC